MRSFEWWMLAMARVAFVAGLLTLGWITLAKADVFLWANDSAPTQQKET